jgi:hypothetical protein
LSFFSFAIARSKSNGEKQYLQEIKVMDDFDGSRKKNQSLRVLSNQFQTGIINFLLLHTIPPEARWGFLVRMIR